MAASIIDFFVHLDVHLQAVLQAYGAFTYAILFLIIFCETGLVVTPFLPGDSLLFVIGALSAQGGLDITTVFILLSLAAVSGNMVNYHIGRLVGPKIFHRENVRFLNSAYLDKTRRFYERHGGKTIVIARFMPIIRTFAPFVAGIGRMHYGRFTVYNILGCIAWLASFILGGYYFGNIPLVKRNFTLVIFSIIFVSLLPSLVEVLRHRWRQAEKTDST
jgi:membrane-associated protein